MAKKQILKVNTKQDRLAIGFEDLNEAVRYFADILETLKQVQKTSLDKKWVVIPFEGEFIDDGTH